MKRRIILGLVTGLCVSILAGVLSRSYIIENAIAMTCDHVGNHYTTLERKTLDGGTKEYWVCCKCHEHFLEEPQGDWTDNGEASSVSSNDDRYINPIWYKGGSETGGLEGEEITNGWKFNGLLENKAFICKYDSLTLNGLSFTLICENFSVTKEDCIQFYLQPNNPKSSVKDATKPLVFTICGAKPSSRSISCYLSHSVDTSAQTIAKAEMNPGTTKTGFSNGGGPLLLSCNTTITLNLSFSFAFVNSFMKMTITSNSDYLFNSTNYNVNANRKEAFTYIFCNQDISLSNPETGKMYLGFIANRYNKYMQDSSFSVQI